MRTLHAILTAYRQRIKSSASMFYVELNCLNAIEYEPAGIWFLHLYDLNQTA